MCACPHSAPWELRARLLRPVPGGAADMRPRPLPSGWGPWPPYPLTRPLGTPIHCPWWGSPAKSGERRTRQSPHSLREPGLGGGFFPGRGRRCPRLRNRDPVSSLIALALLPSPPRCKPTEAPPHGTVATAFLPTVSGWLWLLPISALDETRPQSRPTKPSPSVLTDTSSAQSKLAGVPRAPLGPASLSSFPSGPVRLTVDSGLRAQ